MRVELKGLLSVWTLTAVCLLGSAGPAAARPAHLRSLVDHYGPFLPGKLANCSTCHLGAPAKSILSLADFPHNDYGKRLAAVQESLRSAGARADLPARLNATAAEDSDGDGASNRDELLTGRRPGERADRPSARELKDLPSRIRAYRSFERSYRWRPFDPVIRPAVPVAVSGSASGRWVRNPIDAFVAAEHARRGLRPRPPASRPVLLRRVYLDLTGLSPSPEELRAFLADRSPDAYEKIVDRLLASPHYGERWGRHWMDVWRYSDWTGYGEQVRDSMPHVWRWRDWIVESLNAGKGYDSMVQEMLAADELYPTDPGALRATGFLVRNYKLLSREKWLQDTVDHAGQAFLGLTVGCARCHDHMTDPITQKDYYRLRALFQPHNVRTDWVPGEADPKKDGLVRAFDAKPDDPTYLLVRGDERQPAKDDPLAPGVPEALGGGLRIEPVSLPLFARAPERQAFVIDALRAEAARLVERSATALAAAQSGGDVELARLKLDAAEAAQASLEAVLRAEQLEDRNGSPEWTAAAGEAVMRQRSRALADARLKRLELGRALEQAKKGGKLEMIRKAEEAIAAAETAAAKAEAESKQPTGTAYQPRSGAGYPGTSTGRRLAFARWLTDSRNPLTARVAVNHVWLRHFGRGLVPNPADFGRSAEHPSHPELLDWLAVYFMEGGTDASGDARAPSGWSFKPLHRLIVTSSAYRMGSTPDSANLAKDMDNRYLWRMNSRRMDAEIIRDNILHVAGQLDPAMGGPDIDHALGLTVKRRSLYFRHAAEKEMVFLQTFDGPSVLECYARKETVVPQQAMAMANSEISLVQARLLARSLSRSEGMDPSRFARAAFERILARRPSPAELSESVAFLRAQPRLFPASVAGTASADSGAPIDGGRAPALEPALRARENLVLVLLNHHDFVTIR